eukprot:Gb_23224 [translate_table: standard]
MGSVCCVAARPEHSSLNNHRRPMGLQEPRWRTNGGFSPPIYSQWDDKSQAEDDVAAMSSMQFQRALSLNSRGSRVASPHFSSHQRTISGIGPNEGSPSDSFRASKWLNSPILLRNAGDSVHAPADLISSPSITQTSSKEGGHSVGSSTVSNTPESTPPHLNMLEFSSAHSKNQPPSSHRHSIGSNLFFSRRPHHISSHPLSRQISDSRIHARNAVNGSSMPLSEGRHSFKLSGSSGDSMVGSHGGASDWWSMQTFSDLVASSRRERLRWTDASSPSDFRWAPGKESMDRATLAGERIRANGSQAASLSSSVDVQSCAICSKLITQRSPWSAQKVIASNDLSVVAVLACGHVYHAECLEKATPEGSQQDPPCPVCVASENMIVNGQKSVEQSASCKGRTRACASHGQSSRNKISRIGVAYDDAVGSEVPSGFKFSCSKDSRSSGNGIKLSSSSSEKSFLSKSFSKRHFFFRGKSVKNLAVSDHVYKKGFWGKQRKE